MASGYARVAGKPGVCIATSGPGATNLITGIATAYMDSVPLIAITGQVNLEQLGRDVFQEADITGACHSFTKHSYLVKSAADLPRVFKEAFHIAATGRPGPVLIDVPQDVQEQLVESFTYPEKADIPGYKPNTAGHPMQVKRAAQAIGEAKRPVIVCGGGVVSAGAREEMLAFAKKTGIPAVATMMGLGVFPGNPQHMGKKNPVYLGMIGRYGRSCAQPGGGGGGPDPPLRSPGGGPGHRRAQPDRRAGQGGPHRHRPRGDRQKHAGGRAHCGGHQAGALRPHRPGPRGLLSRLGGAGPGLPPGRRRAWAGPGGLCGAPLLPAGALLADGGGLRPGRRPGPGADLGRPAPHPAPGAVPHQRGPGHHGLRPARRPGGQAGPARPPGGGGVRRRRLPDEPLRAGHRPRGQRPT